MKFGQLIETRETFFLKNHTQKCHGETIPRPFSEKLKLSISLDPESKVLYSLYLLHAKLRAIKTY